MILQLYIRDGGLPYVETDLNKFIVEPWNFATALLFVLLAFYWFRKISWSPKNYSFLFFMVMLLLIGGIGGTIYHGFRYHQVFIMMDWLPIMLITFSASVYFFIRSWGKWWPPIILILLYIVLQSVLFSSGIPIQTAINVSYASMAILVLFPVIWYLIKTKFRNYWLVVSAIVLFGVALFFRWADKFAWFTMGTHFLWHIFGLIATYFMFKYVYFLNEKE